MTYNFISLIFFRSTHILFLLNAYYFKLSFATNYHTNKLVKSAVIYYTPEFLIFPNFSQIISSTSFTFNRHSPHYWKPSQLPSVKYYVSLTSKLRKSSSLVIWEPIQTKTEMRRDEKRLVLLCHSLRPVKINKLTNPYRNNKLGLSHPQYKQTKKAIVPFEILIGGWAGSIFDWNVPGITTKKNMLFSVYSLHVRTFTFTIEMVIVIQN